MVKTLYHCSMDRRLVPPYVRCGSSCQRLVMHFSWLTSQGTVIHNIELRPVRVHCSFVRLAILLGWLLVRALLCTSFWRRLMPDSSVCKATVGSVGNSDHALEQSGKQVALAGWAAPHNRGVVMNLLITQWVVVKVASLVVIHVHVRLLVRKGSQDSLHQRSFQARYYWKSK